MLVPLFFHTAPLDNLEFPGTQLGEDSLFTPTHLERAIRPHTIIFLLCGWQSEGHSLPVDHPFDLDIAKALVLRAEKRLELPPPFWHSSVLLQVGADPLACMVWVSSNISPGFLCLLGTVAAGLECRGWRRRGIRSIRLLGRFYKFRDFQALWKRTWDLEWHDPLT